MIVSLLIVAFIAVELVLLFASLKKGQVLHKERFFTRLSELFSLLLLSLTPLVTFSSGWYGLYIFCIGAILLNCFGLVRKKQVGFTKSKMIRRAIASIVLLLVVSFPLFLFPSNKPLPTTGTRKVLTQSYTFTDTSREEYFTEEEDDNRQVSVQFWYPEQTNKSYPLVIFSHGAFGYRMSNFSTYEELAGNGYVVCSIDHTYHSFFTKQADGTHVVGDFAFINEAVQVTNNQIEKEQLYELEKKWMDIRTKDFMFVLDQIKKNAMQASWFTEIDLDHIGAMGHSMGGATAAWAGRNTDSIDAVVVLDGTMMGERTGLNTLYEETYPTPILNFFAEDHYEQAISQDTPYANLVIHENNPLSYQVVIRSSGHLNFTDLPHHSPILASLLGTGKIDAEYCITTYNAMILEFFDHFLKGANSIIPRERLV